jgi:hypothetical protein
MLDADDQFDMNVYFAGSSRAVFHVRDIFNFLVQTHIAGLPGQRVGFGLAHRIIESATGPARCSSAA